MEPLPLQTYQDPAKAMRSARSGHLFQIFSGKRRETIFWILQTVFWSVIGLIGYVMILAFQGATPNAGWAVIIRIASGFLLTSGLRWIYRSSGLNRRRGIVKCLWVAGCCMAATLLEFFIQESLSFIGVSIIGLGNAAAFRLLVVRFFTIGVWSTLYQGIHLLEDEHALEMRVTKEELAAREHELRHLQAQMTPHFVLNALDTVIASKNDPEAVENVTQNLADYIHFLLKETHPLEPLSREINAFGKYLDAQKSHYGKNLICRINCEPSVRSVMVPPMMIQPLLEDALRHRSLNDDAQVQIWLTARAEDGFLRVTVSNTGNLDIPEANPLEPPYLRSLRQRLHLLLGPQAVVDHQVEGGWMRVTIEIPLPDRPMKSEPSVWEGKAVVA